MIVCGIDPGLSGALALLDPSTPAAVETVDVPVHVLTRGGKTKREVDVAALIRLLASRPVDHAFVEAVASRPGQGLSSTFAFGKAYGIILGIIAARGIPLTLVPAVRWKRLLHVPKTKDGSRARASQLFPEAAHQWRLKKADGRAEAALIALCGARQLSGTAAVPADLFVLSVPAGPESRFAARGKE
jgi:crossover junction endodeoxyribonuclease RuvC